MVEERFKVKMEREETENIEQDNQAQKKIKVENKTLDSNVLDSELKDKIAKQIHYYFSDVNLMRDKFMLEEFKKNDGVKLSVLATFTRLAQLTKDENMLLEALKDSKSDLLEVDEIGKLVKRKTPLPDKEQYQKGLISRSVHISGFPDSVTFDDLHRFCSRYGEVESLSMRKHFKTNQFKGCIHLVYNSDSSAKKVLESEEFKFKDRDLRREAMDKYYERKEDMRKSRRGKKKVSNEEGDKVDKSKNESEDVEDESPIKADKEVATEQ